MRPAIQFNDQFSFAVQKISHVGANRRLSYKLETFQLTITQLFPKPPFCWRTVVAERSGLVQFPLRAHSLTYPTSRAAKRAPFLSRCAGKDIHDNPPASVGTCRARKP
jgi:hypothetical protein